VDEQVPVVPQLGQLLAVGRGAEQHAAVGEVEPVGVKTEMV
jgi:hypothetical protein